MIHITRTGLHGVEIDRYKSVILTRTASTVPAFGGINRHELGFLCRTVLIDNPTGQWWYVPEANVRIPPYTVAMSIILHAAPQSATIHAETPSGQTSTPVAGQVFTATFTSLQLPAAAGILV